MKLYATTTSERASKGQGGNNEIVIDLKIENEGTRERIGMIKLSNYKNEFVLSYSLEACNWVELKKVEKGKQQKGDNCEICDKYAGKHIRGAF